MFTRPTALDASAHRDLRFTANQPYDFARDLMLIPLVAGEATRVAREMPIVFPMGEEVPQALVGVRPGENLHVKDSGHWVGRYVPAHLRRYPFLLAEISTSEDQQSEKGRQYALQFDAAARHFERPDGQALIDSQGKPTEILQKIQKVLMSLQQERERTLELVKKLDQAGLLVERSITVVQGEDKHELGGFRILDEKALARLDAEPLAKLRDSGALALAYAHLLSLSNLKDGLIAKAAAGADAAPDLDEVFGSDDDFSFDFDS
ncbi:MAG: SapC family protein [Pseudomonadota bacterium]